MNILLLQAEKMLHIPYIWGGNSPISGLDCSGLVCELMKSCGELPPGDYSAQGLFEYFSNGRGEWNRPGLGALVWFGKSASEITHVGMCLDQYRMIEAGGGGKDCLTVADAIRKNAMVRIRLINSRTDQVALIKPYFRKIGML